MPDPKTARTEASNGPMRRDWVDRLQNLTASNDELLDALRKQELEWLRERQLFRAMIDQVPDYLFVKDRDSRFVIANKAVAADLGVEPRDLIGKTDLDLHPPALAAKFFADEQGVIASERPMLDIEEFVIPPSGRQKWLSTSKLPLRNSSGDVVGIVGVCRDVTDRKQAEARIRHLAHHDALTGLPNRLLLVDRLDQAIRKAERDGTKVGVMFVDIDRFKSINDSLGHSAGDLLLQTLSDRMTAAVGPTDTVARLAGDEFVILLQNVASEDATRQIVERVQNAIAKPVLIGGQPLGVSCSIGVARYPDDADTPEALLKSADVAMYHAKESGRDTFAVFTPTLDAATRELRLLREGLPAALARHEFFLVYQPQIELDVHRVRAVEALLRWNHPGLGLVMPQRFIPLAEETGFIVPLGEWAIREACRQNMAWQRAGLQPIVVAVNVSSRQFRDGSIVSTVKAALADSGLDPRFLELELTESVLIDNTESAVATMEELKAIGVHFSIDDFGTGYSSLSALSSLPIAHLKIDRSFIENLSRSERDRIIARTVIAMARKLQMRVIAEGVENQEQLSFLHANQCDGAQGFMIGRPAPPDAIQSLLSSVSPRQAPGAASGG